MSRFVFIDETWVSTNMSRRHGRGRKGLRLVSSVPHGHWNTTTFVAALRSEVSYRFQLGSTHRSPRNPLREKSLLHVGRATSKWNAYHCSDGGRRRHQWTGPHGVWVWRACANAEDWRYRGVGQPAFRQGGRRTGGDRGAVRGWFSPVYSPSVARLACRKVESIAYFGQWNCVDRAVNWRTARPAFSLGDN